MATYTFSVEAIIAFDVDAETETEAKQEAEKQIAKVADGCELTELMNLWAPYFRLKTEKLELEDVYP